MPVLFNTALNIYLIHFFNVVPIIKHLQLHISKNYSIGFQFFLVPHYDQICSLRGLKQFFLPITHGPSLQFCISVSSVPQSLPPFAGGGLEQVLVRV